MQNFFISILRFGDIETLFLRLRCIALFDEVDCLRCYLGKVMREFIEIPAVSMLPGSGGTSDC